jgi:hypothetical protein
MSDILISAGPFRLKARLERADAPATCRAFEALLPWSSQFVHVRWSGEGIWIPLGERRFDFGYENHTSHPAPGHFIFYPGGISETEILLAYGGVAFSSKMGQLAGNHFLTVTEGQDQLRALGTQVLWKGATDVAFARLD